MTTPFKRPCEACGAKIVFILGPDGKRIPVQKVRLLYTVNEEGDHLTRLRELVGGIPKHVYISHYETCPSPEQFKQRTR